MKPEETPGYSIRNYHNVNEIYQQIEKLVGQAIHPIKREEMELYLEGFKKRYKSSLPVIDKAMQYIPGGVQHNLAFNYPFPLYLTGPKVPPLMVCMVNCLNPTSGFTGD